MTPLHRLELASAWNLKVFRKEIAAEVVAASLGDLASDVATGLFRVPTISMDEALSTGERLALAHAARLGTRSLDTLHVAAALLVGATDFVTGDERQASLAEEVGLRVTRFRST
jgi:predicted nucleic acid-binding protein